MWFVCLLVSVRVSFLICLSRSCSVSCVLVVVVCVFRHCVRFVLVVFALLLFVVVVCCLFACL